MYMCYSVIYSPFQMIYTSITHTSGYYKCLYWKTCFVTINMHHYIINGSDKYVKLLKRIINTSCEIWPWHWKNFPVSSPRQQKWRRWKTLSCPLNEMPIFSAKWLFSHVTYNRPELIPFYAGSPHLLAATTRLWPEYECPCDGGVLEKKVEFNSSFMVKDLISTL